MQINLGCYLKICLPFFFQRWDKGLTVLYTLLVIVLHMGSVYTHLKIWLTEPGYPERVSTAQIKLNFNKAPPMSDVLKELINKRNKGFVALLNSNQSNFTRYQNQCFECKLKPLKPIRSYHC